MAWQDSAIPADQPASSTPGWQANAIPADQPPTPDDSLLGHLHRFSQGFTNVTRAATDWPTAGLVDKLFGQQAQADTAAAHRSLGALDLPVSLVGGLATGGPELKAASMLGEAIAGGRLGAAIGGAAAGGGTGALGAYGHEAGWTPDLGDIGKGAAIGAALNAGAGALSGPAVEAGQVAGRTFTPRGLPTARSAADLEAAAKQTYAPLSNVLYDAGSEVHPHLDVTDAKNALRDWSGYKWNDATKTSGEINTLLNKPQLSANDLQQSQSYLKGIASKATSDPNDQLYAGYYAKKLQDALEQGVPQTGVPPGAGPGYAADVKGAGDLLHGRAQDMKRLENMEAAAAVKGGPDVSNQMRSFLTSDEGRRFAPAGLPLYEAGNTVAGLAAKPETIPWYVKHFMIAPMAGMLGNEIFAGVSGSERSPMEHVAADLGVGATLMGGTAGYSALTGALKRAAQQRAIDALKSTITTGALQQPLPAPTPVRNALRMLLFGEGGR